MLSSSSAPSSAPFLTGAQIRQAFIDFFAQKLGHKAVASASLIPSNPTVLLTPAGMLPFVPIFLGIEPPPSPPRVVSSQKCARVSGKASDLDYVGRTPRHHTFFEMLGNFSFGDYFKHEMIPWAWQFITQELGIPTEKLWVSVYQDDMEARDIWRDQVGVPESRIVFRGKKDNFWGPPGPTGPCGPCSEIFYDFGLASPSDNPATDPEFLDQDRFMEIWNLVFMEFFQDADGQLSPLEKKNIDTGMGLERITMVLQQKTNTFETDLLFPLVEHAARLCGKSYGQNPQTDTALKIVADHVRCVTFALADGIVPSNEGRGYIIRMILRRAVRYGKKYLGFSQPFLYQLVQTVQQLYVHAYPELKAGSQIAQVIQQEEQRFFETLERGLSLLEEQMQQAKAEKAQHISGEAVFKLYDTYGFPVELTEDIAREEGLAVDHEGFEAAMKQQQAQSRQNRKEAVIVADQVFSEILRDVGPTAFLGYETLNAPATVKALILNGQRVETVSGTNQPFLAVLDQTPFYAESGGQVGDQGAFSRETGPHGLTVGVHDTTKVGELFVHHCLFDNGGTVSVGETLVAQVEPVSRHQAALHHTATHLLNAALKHVLGEGVNQAGSHVSSMGARFDFTFTRGLTTDELQRVEYQINKWIWEATPRQVELLPLEEAKARGAVAMFGEKYGDVVRVVSYGRASKELCGGTHVDNLSQLGLVKLVSESAIASGVRRIELLAGPQAFKAFKVAESQLSLAAALLKVPPQDVHDRLQRLLDQLKQQEKALQQAEQVLAAQAAQELLQKTGAAPFQPIQLHQLSGLSAGRLKAMTEAMAAQLPSHVVVLASNDENNKAQFVCSVSADRVKAGLKAGDLVKQAAAMCGGGGGGKPNFAQAGGKDPSQIGAALQVLRQTLGA